MIYFDNAATTKMAKEAAAHMQGVNEKIFGNPSSLHSFGLEAERIVTDARKTIAETIGANPQQIHFTSGGTEANNLAILGYLQANPRAGKHIIATKIEHASVHEVYAYLETQGYEVDYIPVSYDGLVDIAALEEMVREDTALVSIVYVNSEIGVIQNMDEIVSVVKSSAGNNLLSTFVKGNQKGVMLHTDFVQGFCKIPIDLQRTKLDLLSASGHKLHGPKGTGFLYVRDGIKIAPLLYGGGQENGLRSGTENVPAIAGLGAAVQKQHAAMHDNYGKVRKLNEQFRNALKEAPFEYMILSPGRGTPYILSVAFRNVKAEVIVHHLSDAHIYVSAGSACAGKRNKVSRVVQALQVSETYAEGVLRFSFSADNTAEEVEKVVDALFEIIPTVAHQVAK